MDIYPIWSRAQKIIEEKVGTVVKQTWFDPIKARLEHPHTLILEMPDVFFKGWFERHYSSLLREILNGIEPGLNISLSVIPEAGGQQPAQTQNPPQARSITPTINLPHINPRYSFENFIVGSSNRFAHAAALAIVDAPAKAYNPLSIYGGVGLGKTHLMQAICLASFKRNPKIKISYTTSECFTNELIEAIRGHSTNAFRAKYRNVDILLIDDIQFIAGKESTQEEFFHTFNALYDNHKQIIMSSDRPSKEIPNLQERLISRFSWGLVTDIQPPDFETRAAILRKKIELEPFKVPDEVISFIAEHIKTNIRELEGALIRVVAYSSLEERAISLHLAREVLKDMLKETKKTVTIELIQRSVADFFSLSVGELKNKKRNKQFVLPRQIAMYLTRELTNHSLPDIGEAFSGKDHTTVLYACNKIKREIKEDKKISDIIDKLSTDIKS
ncbi:MAG: chromosomal replication initiator protein DnaA [Candidatus Omnitrophota bacterium]|nr:chromosomal replication initiator protein DnaA [Candidatus Omnitrophota bacterium]